MFIFFHSIKQSVSYKIQTLLSQLYRIYEEERSQNKVIRYYRLFFRSSASTCVQCPGAFGMMNTNLQFEELHNLLFENSTGPLFGPDTKHSRQKLLSELTHSHSTVHSRRSQEDVESWDKVIQNKVLLLPNGITVTWVKTVKGNKDPNSFTGSF